MDENQRMEYSTSSPRWGYFAFGLALGSIFVGSYTGIVGYSLGVINGREDKRPVRIIFESHQDDNGIDLSLETRDGRREPLFLDVPMNSSPPFETPRMYNFPNTMGPSIEPNDPLNRSSEEVYDDIRERIRDKLEERRLQRENLDFSPYDPDYYS